MKILIVEDDEYKRKYVEDILVKKGIVFHVEKAINPALKFIHLNNNKISGIILDLSLPRFNNFSTKTIKIGGFSIVNEITRLRLEIPILINSYDADNVKYDDYVFDTSNIKGVTGPLLSSYAEDINLFISSIEKGEF